MFRTTHKELETMIIKGFTTGDLICLIHRSNLRYSISHAIYLETVTVEGVSGWYHKIFVNGEIIGKAADLFDMRKI